ncbi:MAG: hypothetical protein HWN68_17300 [Desulfobacterales bacterium]|nr:hypothetical protein [Desulfobacterales bacterium]
MSEPVGVMKFWECVEKHSRDMEHHLEDIVRVAPARERVTYEDWIDGIRAIRLYAHKRAKGISVRAPRIKEYVPPHFSNPAEPVRKDLTKYWERPPYEELYPPKTEDSDEEEVHLSEPIRRERGKEVYVDVYHEKEECHPSSFRVIKPNPEHLLTICCPHGQYDPVAGRCLTGTMAQKIEHLHPEGEGSCPVCAAGA